MKTIIIYYSMHHGNTKKLVDAVAAQDNTVEVFDITSGKEKDLSVYDRIGIASGIYFSKYNEKLLAFTEKKLPMYKEVFFMHTAGSPRENQNDAIKKITDAKKCKCLGTYFCKGFDTYGPFKLIGGIAKGHPDVGEIADGVTFYQNL